MEATIGQPISTAAASPALPGAGDAGLTMPATPAPAAAAAPAATAAPVQTAQRGHFFSGIEWTDVLMFGLFIYAGSMSVYASYQHILFLRASKKAHSQDLDEIKSNLQTIMGDQYQSFSS